MGDLADQRCEACRAGAPLVTPEEIRGYHPSIPDWEVIEVDGVQRLTRVFSFRNFAEALDFTNKVGKIAEEEGHHPDIFLAWGKVKLTIFTHTIDGLSEADFILAARIDRLASQRA